MHGKDRLVRDVTKKLTDEGRIIEAGWVGLKLMAVPDDAPPIQISEMRNAFFAGAQHLFSSLMVVMEPGAEPTDNDIRRFELVDRELRQFIKEFQANIKGRV